MALPHRRVTTRPQKTYGRYDLTGARSPASGPSSPQINVRTAVVAVDDPGELIQSESGRLTLRQESEGRVIAQVNRRTDVLENERSHGRLNDAAYTVGRIVQAVFERARGPGGGGQWREGDRVDAWLAHELGVIHGILRAEAIRSMVAKIRKAVGRIDANILQRVLGENCGFADVASLVGKANAKGPSYIAERFRDALDDLAEAFAVKGRGEGSGLRDLWAGELAGRAEECRAQAERCREMAGAASNADRRELLEKMAGTFEMLATASTRMATGVPSKNAEEAAAARQTLRDAVALAKKVRSEEETDGES